MKVLEYVEKCKQLLELSEELNDREKVAWPIVGQTTEIHVISNIDTLANELGISELTCKDRGAKYTYRVELSFIYDGIKFFELR